MSNVSKIGSEDELFKFRSIGTCYSMFANKRGVPRQGNLAPSTEATIKLHVHMARDSLMGLDSYSHVWILFVFNRNTNKKKVQAWVEQNGESSTTFPSKIKPPLLKGESTGLYSTRSPHRPNPIGMTLAKIKSVDMAARTLVVSGVDICDETPVIDIKPFVPSDVPFGTPKYASWVQSEDNIQWSVTFSKSSEEKLQYFIDDGVTEYYKSLDDLKKAITEVLQLDIRAVYQGRGQTDRTDPVPSQCVVDNLQIFFDTDEPERSHEIVDIKPYDKSVLPPV